MRLAELHQALQKLGRRHRWCLTEASLRAFFPDESENTFRTAMSRHVRQGVLQRLSPGLYLNPYATPPANAAELLASYLRPDDFFYLSLESALHEFGWISQVPFVATFMTTGSSHTFRTEVGTIEFVHTSRPIEVWRSRTRFDPKRRIYVASKELAFEDLTNVGRNLDLVEKDARDDLNLADGEND